MSILPSDPLPQPSTNTYYEINFQIACLWARLGIAVFPCRQDKTPYTSRGHLDASTDLLQIQLWWSAYPDAIPAFSPGAAGLFVADLDRHDGKVDGVANFKALAAEHGQSARDFIPVHTAGGGVHLYFRNTFPVKLGCGRGPLFKGLGIDFRGDGGYVIAGGATLADGRRWGSPEEVDGLYRLIAEGRLQFPPQWMLSGGAGTSAPETEPQNCYDGPVTPEMIAHARNDVVRTAAELSLLGPRSNRGDASHALALRIGFLIREGHLDHDWCQTELRLAMPDNPNAWGHCFDRGVARSVGATQAAQHARREKWEASWERAQAQGLQVRNPPSGTTPRNPMPRFEGMPRFKPNGEASSIESEIVMPRFIPDADEVPLGIRLNLRAGACMLLASARDGRKAPEKRNQLIEQAWLFIRSLLAAGFATRAEMVEAWSQTMTSMFRKADSMTQSWGVEIKKKIEASSDDEDPTMARLAARYMEDEDLKPLAAVKKALMVAELEDQRVEHEGAQVRIVKVEDIGERFARFDAPGSPPAWVEHGTGRFLSDREMDIALGGQFVCYMDGNGEPRLKPAALAFRAWADVHVYSEIVFTGKPIEPYQLNLFHGFGVSPRAGDCERIKQHVVEVLCAGDRDAAEAFFDLEAWQLQNIGTPSRVLRIGAAAPQQTGKNIYYEQVMLKIYGSAGLSLSNKEPLKGRFNMAFLGKACVLCDEMTFAGDHDINNALKRLSAATKLHLEPKGKEAFEAPVALNLVVLTNSETAAVSVEEGDVRVWALRPSDHRVGDHAYFDALADEMEHGGIEAYLAFLLARDVTEFKPQRDTPMDNELKREMITASVRHGSIPHWLLDVVAKSPSASYGGSGGIMASSHEFPFGKRISTQKLYAMYEKWHKSLHGRFVEDITLLPNFKLAKYGFVTGFVFREDGKSVRGAIAPTRSRLAKALGIDLSEDDE